MKAYVTFTKKRIAVLMAVFLCVGFVCCQLYTAGNNVLNAKTNADRLIFIKRLGYSVTDKTPTSKSVIIPEVFYDTYNDYNLLQRKSGYDLSLYKGCAVTLYSYKIKTPQNYDDECVINIIVYNDRVIGGDVSSVIIGGFMLPIKSNNEKTKT